MKKLFHNMILVGLALLCLQGGWSLVPQAGTYRSLFLDDMFVSPVEASYRPTVIKSVQRGTISLGGASNTATITAVTTANSILAHLDTDWDGGTSTAEDQANVRLEFTNSTTITGNRTTGGNTTVVGFEVVEFYTGVLRNVQRGTITIGAGSSSNTSTITSVVTGKSAAATLGYVITNNLETGYNHARITLTNATTVTASRISSVGTAAMTVGYQVAEFK